MPVGQKHTIPAFTIFDKPQDSRYFIKWQLENGKATTKSRKYGGNTTKEQAYKDMLDIRYELVMNWLELNKGLKSTGTQWTPQEE
jgi:hypothetical protein